MTEKALREIWRHHRGKIVGSLAGLVFSLLVITVGFLWALFIAFCVGVGYIVGKRLDEEQEHVLDILSRILPPGPRHR